MVSDGWVRRRKQRAVQKVRALREVKAEEKRARVTVRIWEVRRERLEKLEGTGDPRV